MNISVLRGGIPASALLLAVATTAPMINQSSPSTTKPQDGAQQGSSFHGQQGQHGMEQIASAYRQLRQVTLSTLQENASGWKDKSAVESMRGTSTASTSLSLRAEELLIAGCSEGLLAGAPSGTSSRDARKPAPLTAGDSRSDGGQSSQSDPDRSRQAGGVASSDGQSVGMLLVSAHSMGGATTGQSGTIQKSENEPRDAFGERDASARNASGVLGADKLKPGVYCVKQSDSSVWLTDQDGRIVLRTTLDAQRGNRSPKAADFGGQERESDLAGQRAGQSDWEDVFAAISEEAMHSMGWAKQGALASMR